MGTTVQLRRTFWTPLSPIDRFIGLKLHEKYPTLLFAFQGCNELEVIQKAIWNIDGGDRTDPRLAENEAWLSMKIHTLHSIAMFIPGFDPNEFWAKVHW
jgi:hypothetical protein